MEIGYKARSLERIKNKGLPSLWYDVLEFISKEGIEAVRDKFNGNWAIRTDYPINTGCILPLFGSNKQSNINATCESIRQLSLKDSRYSFILSEAPNDKDREANIVCQMDDTEILYGEIGYEPMTLRDAWTRGRIHPFVIDGSIRDYLCNRKSYLTRQRIEILRNIRNLLKGDICMYEISVMDSYRLIFWQEMERCELNSSHFLL